MKNRRRMAILVFAVLLTLTLGAGAQSYSYNDPSRHRQWIEAARQMERASENFVRVLDRRVRGFEGVSRQAQNLYRAARRLTGSDYRGYPGHSGSGIREIEAAFHDTRNAIHSGIHFPRNQRSERSYYALIHGWAQVVYAFDRLQDEFPEPGRGNGPYPPSDRYRNSQVLRCESRNYRRAECRVPGRILEVQVLDQHSRASCREGRSFGFRDDRLWVDEGCVADFRVTFR